MRLKAPVRIALAIGLSIAALAVKIAFIPDAAITLPILAYLALIYCATTIAINGDL